jgi:tetratricopeptide (TPR) repeat protein
MQVLSSIFLLAALVLTIVIGPQTRPWTWGPAFLMLSVSVLAAIPVIWKRGRHTIGPGILTMSALTAAWFAWRAWNSPVAELAHADLLLLCGAVGAFISMRAIAGNALAERILAWGVALLLLANVVVVGKQFLEPGYTPVLRPREGTRSITGFFAHYNEAANYLIASSMLVAAAAIFGCHATATRILWGLIAIAGMASVWLTRSRGGILGLAIAAAVFAVLILILGKRRSAKWFVPALIGMPAIGLMIGAFLYIGWQQAQLTRHGQADISVILDNDCRLYFLGMAVSCIQLHPITGGGARSFSWECFQFADVKTIGNLSTRKPELVHNEFMQAATDYGIIGAVLLALLLIALVISAIMGTGSSPRREPGAFGDAWRIGTVAAFAGMMVQSCFSFVFHLLPGVLLLGLCLGGMGAFPTSLAGARSHAVRGILTAVAAICLVALIPNGWRGARATLALWHTHYGKEIVASAESNIDALGEAIRIWPHSSFHLERAGLFQTMAGTPEQPGFTEAAQRAAADYEIAARLHPHDPGAAVNLANVLGLMERDAEAEQWHEKAIQLQGGMESGFMANFSMAYHLLRKGLRQFDPAHPEKTLESLELAAALMETAVKQMHWVTPEMREPRLSIHESLGAAREAAGDPEGALMSYDFASKLHHGERAHYRAAVLIGKNAVDAWSKRKPSEALKLFNEAHRRIQLSGGKIPNGVTPAQRVEYIAYLDKTIAFLKGARVLPAE